MAPIKVFKCCICEKWKGKDRHLEETVDVGDTEHGFTLEVCDTCVADIKESRKFEDVPARVLYECHEEVDDTLSSEGWGWLARIHNWIVTEDTQGFVEATRYPSEERAIKEYERYYDAGMGYCEDDIVIQPERWGAYGVWQNHRCIATINSDNCTHGNYERRARAVASLHMRKTGYYGSVWLGDERGNIRRVEVW